MLTIGRIYSSAGAGEYVAQYYADGRETEGAPAWFGRGAEQLGLARHDRTAENIASVLEGRHPADDRALVQNAGRDGRCMGFDLTLSAPKSVSVGWALGDEPDRSAIGQAHESAVRTVVDRLEEGATSRTGKGGRGPAVEAGLVGVQATHFTSRAGDPQLHTHVVLANLGVGSDGRTRALDTRGLFDRQRELGQVYQQALRENLQARGFAVEQDPRNSFSFRLSAVSPDVEQAFSKRSAQVAAGRAAQAERRGRELTVVERRRATIFTRDKKPEGDSLQAHLAHWRAEGRDLGVSRLDLSQPSGPESARQSGPAQRSDAAQQRQIGGLDR